MDLTTQAQSLGIGSYQWHLLLCADASKPKCFPKEEGLRAWDYLKRRIVALGLDRGEVLLYRSKVNCLRICSQGPILLVYPGGYWYHSATEGVLDRILQEHIQRGEPVTEFLFAQNPLAAPDKN